MRSDNSRRFIWEETENIKKKKQKNNMLLKLKNLSIKVCLPQNRWQHIYPSIHGSIFILMRRKKYVRKSKIKDCLTRLMYIRWRIHLQDARDMARQ